MTNDIYNNKPEINKLINEMNIIVFNKTREITRENRIIRIYNIRLFNDVWYLYDFFVYGTKCYDEYYINFTNENNEGVTQQVIKNDFDLKADNLKKICDESKLNLSMTLFVNDKHWTITKKYGKDEVAIMSTLDEKGLDLDKNMSSLIGNYLNWIQSEHIYGILNDLNDIMNMLQGKSNKLEEVCKDALIGIKEIFLASAYSLIEYMLKLPENEYEDYYNTNLQWLEEKFATVSKDKNFWLFLMENIGKTLILKKNIKSLALEEKKEEELLYEKANNLYYGKNVEKDYKKAFEIFKGLADNKEHLGAIEAVCYMYYYGKGIDVNYELARKYCEKVEQKNSKCSRNIFQFLGEIYFHGLDVDADYIKAKAYFEKALNDKYDDTYYKLALLYSGNYGIEKDEEKSNDYLNKIEKDLLLSIIYLLLAIKPDEEQNLEGIYKCVGYSREEYNNILINNIPFDHPSAIYYKKVNYLNDEEYNNIVNRLKKKIQRYLQRKCELKKEIFTFENENDIYKYINEIVHIDK